MSKVIIKQYLHSDKSDNANTFRDQTGMDDCPDKFRYALYEVEFKLEVDTETGEYEILNIQEV